MTERATGDEPTENERLILRRLQLERQRLRARGRFLLRTYREQLQNAARGRNFTERGEA